MSAPTYIAGGYKNFTATTQVSTQSTVLIGVLCSTTTAGTFQVYDSAAAATTAPITGVVTPAAGSFTPIYAAAGTGIYIVVTGTGNFTAIYA